MPYNNKFSYFNECLDSRCTRKLITLDHTAWSVIFTQSVYIYVNLPSLHGDSAAVPCLGPPTDLCAALINADLIWVNLRKTDHHTVSGNNHYLNQSRKSTLHSRRALWLFSFRGDPHLVFSQGALSRVIGQLVCPDTSLSNTISCHCHIVFFHWLFDCVKFPIALQLSAGALELAGIEPVVIRISTWKIIPVQIIILLLSLQTSWKLHSTLRFVFVGSGRNVQKISFCRDATFLPNLKRCLIYCKSFSFRACTKF